MSDEAERTLRHAVRSRVVARYVGELGLVLGVAALIPVAGALFFGELPLVLPYGLASALLLVLGLLARRLPAARDLQPNEALVIVAIAFVSSPLVLSGPLVFQGVPPIDAIFEAVSGVTTTGLSTLASVEGRSRTFLLGRAWMQWIGGLGFVVVYAALALNAGLAARRLGAPGPEPADPEGSMRMHARQVLGVYLGLTGVGIVGLAALGAGGFDAVVHTFSGISTGGFAPRDDSLAPLGRRLQAAVLALSFLGAISLSLYAGLRRGRWRALVADVEVRTLLVLGVLLFAYLLAATRLAGSGVALADLGLLAVSAQSTTGFATFAIEGLPNAALVGVILSMLIGGSQGSTAGGVKILRFLVVIRLIQWLIARTRLPPHAVTEPRLAGHRLTPPELLGAASLVLLFGGVVVVSWLPFLAAGYEPMPALFEVASAVGTVGLSAGVARPELAPALKAVLCVDMLLGRLEVFALLVALAPRTWIGRRAP